MRTPALAAVLGALATPALAAPAAAQRPPALAAAEQAVVRAVDARNAEALALLERVVNVNSGTQNLAGVRQVGDAFRAEFDALGFRTRWVDGAPFRRAGHLVAEHPGPGPKLLLIGHLDTVFEPSSPFQRWERLTDSTALGPGVTDMKGGNVIIVQALKALRDAGQLDRMHVVVVLNGDEEDAGAPIELARQALTEAARGAAAAIGFEDGPGDPHFAVVSRRGAASWTLKVTGVPAHSSQIFKPEVGAGAVYEGSRILSAFYERLSKEPYLTFNPGVVLGGTAVSLDTTGTAGSAAGKSNVVAEHFSATGDLRTLSPEQLARAQATMREIVAQHLPRTTATIEFDDGYPPMAPSDANRRLLATYDRISRDLGLWPVEANDPSRAGAADVSFVAHLVPAAIDGLGLSGTGGHTVKETADLRMLPVQTKRAALLLHRLTRDAAAVRKQATSP